MQGDYVSKNTSQILYGALRGSLFVVSEIQRGILSFYLGNLGTRLKGRSLGHMVSFILTFKSVKTNGLP